MGTEYYLVKPEKKEIFYLGKHFYGFDGINNANYKEIAEYPDYDCWEDFFFDTLRNNWDYFYGTELTLEEASDFIYAIYEWCRYDKVYFDNDCHDGCEWLNWDETGSTWELFKKIRKHK